MTRETLMFFTVTHQLSEFVTVSECFRGVLLKDRI